MKKWQYIFGLVIILVVVLGGYYFYRTRINESNQPGTRVDYELIDRSNYGLYADLADEEKYKTLSATIFSDEASWKRFWENQIRDANTGGFDNYPPVDFDQKRVLALLQGVKPTGGYFLNVTELTVVGKKLVAKVNISEPSDQGVQTQAVSAPYDIVKFDKAVLDGKTTLEVWDVNTNKKVLSQKL